MNKIKQLAANKKLKVGEFSCQIGDTEMGCAPWNNTCPSKDITFSVSCKHEDNKYTCGKCTYAGDCDFKAEITEKELKEYPDLFEANSDRD
jgi:hypothetical protein